jgi:diguanylate cyclase (GGDEF)-like protein/PAS domain S-box-containing protein
VDRYRADILLFRFFVPLLGLLLSSHPASAWSAEFYSRPFVTILQQTKGVNREKIQSIAASLVQGKIIRTWHLCHHHIDTEPYSQQLIEFAILLVLLLSLFMAMLWICLLRKKMRGKIESLRQEIQERKQVEGALRKNENLLKRILETIPLGIWLTDCKGKITYGNPAGRNIWQGARYIEPDEFHQYKAWWSGTNDLISPEEWAVSRAIRNGESSFEEQIDIECFGGTKKTILNWAIPILDDEEQIEGAVVVNQDITERLQMELDLISERDFSKSLIETAQAIILVLNPDGTIRTFNKYLEKITGYSLNEVKGKNWFQTFLLADDWKNVLETFKKAISDIQTAGNINPILTKDGKKRYISWYDKTLKQKDGQVIGLLCTGQDVTEQLNLQQKLQHLAAHDPLTGLYNRIMLEQKLTNDISRSVRYDHKLSILLLDIDHFKLVNDQYGHLEGDNVLCCIAATINDSIRNIDYAARYGGEEFVVVLPETGLNEAKELAERLRKKIIGAETGKHIHVTASIGVSSFPEYAQSLYGLIQSADSSMYCAKEHGRNQIWAADAMEKETCSQ